MGELRIGAFPSKNARRKSTAVVLGACALTVVGASPAAAAGIGDRITDWPVATSLAAALIFGVLAIVFASLARAVRNENSPTVAAPAVSAAAGAGSTRRAPSAAANGATAPSTPPTSAVATDSGQDVFAETRKPPIVAEMAKAPPNAEATETTSEASNATSEPTQPVAAPPPVSEPVDVAAAPAAEKRPRVSDADPLYPLATCRQFATGLGDEVLGRALKLFQPLDQIGRLDSVQLAEMLDARPASLGGLLTTPLSRRADALGLPLPYVIDRVPGTRRRVWRDHADIAQRMSAALREEIALRERQGTRTKSFQSSPNGDSADNSMVGQS